MFTYKSPAEVEAMSEYQREKYFDEKRKFEAAEAAKVAKEAADKAVASAIEPLVKTLATANETIETQKQAFATFKVGVEEREKQVEQAMAEMNRIKTREQGDRIKTLQGEIFDHFSTKEGEAQLANFMAEKGKFNMELKNFNVKAVGTVGKPAGSVAPQFVSTVVPAHEVAQGRNIIPVSPTGSDVIKYVEFTKKEGGIGTVAAGATKPQFDYTTTPKEAPVRKIAGWITLEDEFLEDIEGARDFLAEELPKAYLDAETLQIFKGDGTGTNLSGLYSVHATGLVLPVGTVVLASNRWDKIAAALTQVRRNLRATDAVWISPEDYMELLINKGNTEEYTYPIVSDASGTLRMGGVPIYQHSVFTAGQGLAGDFARGARIFQKKAMVIRTSNEHDVNFVKNLTTILIEGRIALPCYFPQSFVKISFATTATV